MWESSQQGRSAKYTLQAVAASLLQSGAAAFKTDAERDPYWTLVSYYNSLRELGGSLVLMQDDVHDSLKHSQWCGTKFLVSRGSSKS